MKLSLLSLALCLATADDKAGTVQDIPLGPLGGLAKVRHDNNEAEVTQVFAGGAAERAGLAGAC